MAVEPSARMRAEFHRVLPEVQVLPGAAEEIPLEEAAVDVVVVGQAWHWVDIERAVPEVARVLVPGGRLGLVWNIRDEREDWVAQLGRIMHRGFEQDMGSTSPTVGPPFAPIERFDVEWTHDVSAQAVLDLVASRSYIVTLSSDERTATLGRVRDLLHSQSQVVGRSSLPFPYVTHCSRANVGPVQN